MIRYAVRLTDKKPRISSRSNMGTIPHPYENQFYVAIGMGTSQSPQDAHLYSCSELAERKARKLQQKFSNLIIEVVPVTVTGL